MTFISIQEAMDKGKGKIAIRGWVYRERGSNKFKFIIVRDGTNIIQCVIGADHKDWPETDKATMEASVEVKGEIKGDKRAPTGYEIQVESLKVVGESHAFPITKDQSPEFLLDKRHLWIRSRKMSSIIKVRSTVFEAFREFYRNQGYHEMPPPILQPNQCEGGSTLFEVNITRPRSSYLNHGSSMLRQRSSD
ncbi:MAG: amino acid--tRNA ligase-related protein [Nanoarchaeota archaeon]